MILQGPADDYASISLLWFFGPRSCNVAQFFFFFPASCRRRSGLYGDLFLFNLFCFVQQRLFWAMSLFTRRLMSWQFFFSGPAFNLRGPTGSIRVAVFLNSSLLEWVPLRFGQRGPPFKFLERASEANASPVITTFALLFGGGGCELSSISTAVSSLPYPFGPSLCRAVVWSVERWYQPFSVVF